jgi:hypothetical protein
MRRRAKEKRGRGRKEPRKKYRFQPTIDNFKFLGEISDATKPKLSMSAMLNRILFRMRKNRDTSRVFFEDLF